MRVRSIRALLYFHVHTLLIFLGKSELMTGLLDCFEIIFITYLTFFTNCCRKKVFALKYSTFYMFELRMTS